MATTCIEDQGKLVSNSIGAQHATDVQGVFAVRSITVMDVAALCWNDSGFRSGAGERHGRPR